MTAEQPPGDEPQLHADDFVDGRTDAEKLAELLTFPEGSHLDFKAELDLNSSEAKLKFVKDVVAMSNCPPGGYILIGVDDARIPCIPSGTIDRKRFDPAQLADLVRKYIEGRVDLRVAIHDHGKHEVVVVFVVPHPDGLPVPMGKVGNCPDPDKPDRQQTIFRAGEIPVREGAANVPLRRSHWSSLLSTYTRQVHAQAAELAQSMLREFISERQESRDQSPTGKAEIPLLIDMDEATFTDTMRALLDAGSDVQLRRFLRTAAKSLTPNTDLEDFRAALDKWTAFCAQALDYERIDLVDNAIGSLVDAYSEPSRVSCTLRFL